MYAVPGFPTLSDTGMQLAKLSQGCIAEEKAEADCF